MPATPKNYYAVILCGGTGPRLWPLSRTDRPKQFLSILGKDSLLIQTINRALKLTKKDRVFVVTNYRYQTQIKSHLKNLILPKNILIEPDKKNTMMAILFATHHIHQIDPTAIISTFPSDHFIKNIPVFKQTLNSAAGIAAKSRQIVLLGSPATSANPSYGYIKTTTDSTIARFIEKPNPKIIPQLIKDNYFWNLGIYTFASQTFLDQTKKLQPTYFKLVKLLDHSLVSAYQKADNIPIDIALSQKSKDLFMLQANFSWSDVGEWKSIYAQSRKDKHGFAKNNRDSLFLYHQSKDCLIHGQKNKMIGLVGVKDLAIIDTPDALLICHLQDSFNVRNLVEKIVKDSSSKHFFVAQKHD